MDKKLDEIMKLMDEFFEEKKKEKKQDKITKKEIREKLDKLLELYDEDDGTIIAITKNTTLISGTPLTISGTLYAMYKNIQEKGNMPIELLVEAFIRGLATDDDINKINRNKLSEILKAIKKMV